MGWDTVADYPVEFDCLEPRKRKNKTNAGTMPKRLYPLPNATLRDLLMHNLDITGVHFGGEHGTITHMGVAFACQKEVLL